MDENEFNAFQKRAKEEHKKAEKQLERQRTIEKKASKTSLLKQELEEAAAADLGFGQFSKSLAKQDVEWTPEAQSAYKYLVECGNQLQSTSPIFDKSTSSRSSSTSTELTIIAGTHYLRASAPPENQISPATTLERNNYENQSKPPIPSPPQVPPKPITKNKIEAHKVDPGFLSNHRQKESIVKF
uniref:Uncharacterized protein n=1 Tax=Panagrolaimus sp. JU765 TaxID=591449 RepID=A0AC34Q2L0_9BILA